MDPNQQGPNQGGTPPSDQGQGGQQSWDQPATPAADVPPATPVDQPAPAPEPQPSPAPESNPVPEPESGSMEGDSTVGQNQGTGDNTGGNPV